MSRSTVFRQAIYWAFWVLGILLFYLAFHNIPFSDLKNEMASVHLEYLILLLIPSWGGQFLRTWRWKLLLGKEVGFVKIYHSLLFGYFVNLALPRVGELSRCAALHSLGGPPFGKSLGTVVIERIADLMMLVLVVGLAFFLQYDTLALWMEERIFEPLLKFFLSKSESIWIGLAVLLVLGLSAVYLYRKYIKRVSRRFHVLMEEIKEGVFRILRLKLGELFLFVLLSFAIWIGYFFTTWLWFQALPAANGASFGMAFTVMVMGSLVKTLPIQGGGAGAYHIVIGELLVLFGLGTLSSRTFALLNHGYQTVFYLLFGGFSALWIAWRRRRPHGITDKEV